NAARGRIVALCLEWKNRLVTMQCRESIVQDKRLRLGFVYNDLGPRIENIVSDWGGDPRSFAVQSLLILFSCGDTKSQVP
ncbi:hypothetical protein N8612_00535, partial [Verrucomicrobia bacterium]|nr:hypothetical protein [Verrucomicrobiota bacterium]